MTVLTPQLPANSKVVFNSLYDTDDPACLTDDLYAARLINDVHIYVGWFPECSPDGRYEIVSCFESYEKQIYEPVYARTAARAVRQIERLADRLVDRTVTFLYFNDEIGRVHTVIPYERRWRYGVSAPCPQPQWLFDAFDLTNGGGRQTFALQNCFDWRCWSDGVEHDHLRSDAARRYSAWLYAQFERRLAEDGPWPEYTGPGR